MLNPDLYLNKKIFDTDHDGRPNVEMRSLRKGFGQGLVKAAELDKNVVGLCADLTESTCMSDFGKRFPDRFMEMGVAEQDLATVASGMAAMGKIPFMGSFAIFSPGRNWEQIRTTIAYNNRPVKIVGSHAGLSASSDGGSHQALEDIALMRVLPNMTVLSPCDAIEASKATVAAAKTDWPVYIRIMRDDTPIITTEETPFQIGKAAIIFDSRFDNKVSDREHSHKILHNNDKLDVGIISTGPLLYKALKVAKRLDEQGKKVAVMNLSTIKPLDEDSIIRLAHDAGAIVTVEEHQISGGMGSAVAECLGAHFPVPIEFIGVHDQFGQSGTHEELLDLYGISEKGIYVAAQKAMLRK
jgi:transketolase